MKKAIVLALMLSFGMATTSLAHVSNKIQVYLNDGVMITVEIPIVTWNKLTGKSRASLVHRLRKALSYTTIKGNK